jgi:hypothetical protein
MTALLCGTAQADIIYSFVDYQASQNGHSISGTLTTPDTAPDDGYLTWDELSDWELTITGPGISESVGMNVNQDVYFHNVVISPTQIALNPNPEEYSEFLFFSSFDEEEASGFWYEYDEFTKESWTIGIVQDTTLWEAFDPADFNSAGKVIATVASSSPAPEPSTFILFGLGMIGLGGYTWRTRRNK